MEEIGKLNFSQIHHLLCESYPGVSERTVSKHLKKLTSEQEGILEREKRKSYNLYNQTYYSLTAAAKLELVFFDSLRPVKARTKPTVELKQSLEDYEIKINTKAFLLTLVRAATGTRKPRFVDEFTFLKEPRQGAAVSYNQVTGKHEYLIGEEFIERVSYQDIVTHNDTMTLFSHVDFTKSKNYVEILREFGLSNAVEVITGCGDGKHITRIKIADSHWWLKDFLVHCECILSWIGLRIKQTLKIRLMDVLYNNGSLVEVSSIPLGSFRPFERKAFRWYIDMEGRKAFNSLYNDCRRLLQKMSEGSRYRGKNKRKQRGIHKFILEDRKKTEKLIKQWDKGIIIPYYHGLFKCDRKVPNPPWYLEVLERKYSEEYSERKYSEYRQYVREFMSGKYRRLMNRLSEILYPKFLLKHYGKDSELKQFVESLPA